MRLGVGELAGQRDTGRSGPDDTDVAADGSGSGQIAGVDQRHA